jgi:hypothetical protein
MLLEKRSEHSICRCCHTPSEVQERDRFPRSMNAKLGGLAQVFQLSLEVHDSFDVMRLRKHVEGFDRLDFITIGHQLL